MADRLPKNPTLEDYARDYEQWTDQSLNEALGRFRQTIAGDEAAFSALEKKIGMKRGHIGLIESELARRK